MPNTNPDDWLTGDLVFAHSTGIIGKAIRFAERIRGKGGDNWNHVAVLRHRVDGVWYIIQAEAKGVTDDKTLESVAPGGSYEVVRLPKEVDRFSFFTSSQVKSAQSTDTSASCHALLTSSSLMPSVSASQRLGSAPALLLPDY